MSLYDDLQELCHKHKIQQLFFISKKPNEDNPKKYDNFISGLCSTEGELAESDYNNLCRTMFETMRELKKQGVIKDYPWERDLKPSKKESSLIVPDIPPGSMVEDLFK